jgi:hypothetical protein
MKWLRTSDKVAIGPKGIVDKDRPQKLDTGIGRRREKQEGKA